MGTRGAYGFRVDGQDKVTYNHCDSYPSALGDTMVRYVRDHSDQELAEVARRLVLVNKCEAEAPRDMQERYRHFADRGVSSGKLSEWYVLLREAQGQPEAFHRAEGRLEHMIDNRDFLKDHISCEYAYVVNVDSGKLQFYDSAKLTEEIPFETIRTMGKGDINALIKRWENQEEDE
jgi:hypothetical protein